MKKLPEKSDYSRREAQNVQVKSLHKKYTRLQ